MIAPPGLESFLSSVKLKRNGLLNLTHSSCDLFLPKGRRCQNMLRPLVDLISELHFKRFGFAEAIEDKLFSRSLDPGCLTVTGEERWIFGPVDQILTRRHR
jgi:hypothetical protein